MLDILDFFDKASIMIVLRILLSIVENVISRWLYSIVPKLVFAITKFIYGNIFTEKLGLGFSFFVQVFLDFLDRPKCRASLVARIMSWFKASFKKLTDSNNNNNNNSNYSNNKQFFHYISVCCYIYILFCYICIVISVYCYLTWLSLFIINNIHYK